MTTKETLLFSRIQWEDFPFIKFSKEELDRAEKRKDGFIDYRCGFKCILQKFIKEV